MPTPLSWTLVEETPAVSEAGTAAQTGDDTPRDFLLDEDGDLAMVNGGFAYARGVTAIAQSLRIRIRTFLREWFLDDTVGTDWWDAILVKNPNMVAVRAALRERIEGTTGVASIRSFSFNFDRENRELFVEYSVQVDTGLLLTDRVTLEVPI